VKKDGKYFMWIARRSKTKQTFPGMLDNFTAGGLTSGLTTRECAIKELEEEAGVSKELASTLKSVDAITYAYVGSQGVKNETEFVFDLKLPEDFKPFPRDGEVECFYLMSIDEVIFRNLKA
jgi:isopentenyldiphosphate isomerase